VGVFDTEIRRFKWRHPFVWRRAKRELEVEARIYKAVAGVLKAHGIPDETGENYEDEPSYDLMVAVMRVLRREKVKL
jgi:hypothetical protein